MSYYNLDPVLQQAIEPELYSGETLLWVGKPNPARIAQKHVLSVGGALLWLAVAIFILSQFPIFGPFEFGFGGFGTSPIVFFVVIFLGIGLLAVSQPIWNFFSDIRAVYALTDQRALILRYGLMGQSIRSYSESDIETIERRQRQDGSGDIIFAREQRVSRYRTSGGFHRTRRYMMDVGFFGIPDVRDVELLMLETFKLEGGSGKRKRKHDDFTY